MNIIKHNNKYKNLNEKIQKKKKLLKKTKKKKKMAAVF